MVCGKLDAAIAPFRDRLNKRYSILEKLLLYCKKHDVSLALCGEVYGQGIQKSENNPHSKLPVDFAAFSVFNMDKLEYENFGSIHYYENVAGALGIPTVPAIGLFKIDKNVIKYYAEDIDKLNGQPFEGVVIKHSKGSFKVINLFYDSKK